jgi:hypothetical protein
MDSNFQYAGAVNLIVASLFCAGDCCQPLAELCTSLWVFIGEVGPVRHVRHTSASYSAGVSAGPAWNSRPPSD